MYTVRSAEIRDVAELAKTRLQIDGETENMDREQGEDIIDEAGFQGLKGLTSSVPSIK